MDDIVEEIDNVLSFTLFKVEKGRQKICRCNPPHYELDTVNRIVTCADCGATLDTFDAFVTVCDYMKRYEEYQRQAIEKTNTFRELANKEHRRRIKNKIFKDMDRNYQEGLHPHCPKCKKVFDPAKIMQWSRNINAGTRIDE